MIRQSLTYTHTIIYPINTQTHTQNKHIYNKHTYTNTHRFMKAHTGSDQNLDFGPSVLQL